MHLPTFNLTTTMFLTADVKGSLGEPAFADLATVFVTSFLFFASLYFFSSVLFSQVICRAKQAYKGLSPEKVAEYQSRVISNIHAVVSCVNAYISLVHICGEGNSIFNSDTCLINPHKF